MRKYKTKIQGKNITLPNEDKSESEVMVLFLDEKDEKNLQKIRSIISHKITYSASEKLIKERGSL